MCDDNECNSTAPQSGFKGIYRDDKGNISSGRIISLWAWAILTLLLALDVLWSMQVKEPGELYMWLIIAGGTVKAAGKFAEKGS